MNTVQLNIRHLETYDTTCVECNGYVTDVPANDSDRELLALSKCLAEESRTTVARAIAAARVLGDDGRVSVTADISPLLGMALRDGEDTRRDGGPISGDEMHRQALDSALERDIPACLIDRYIAAFVGEHT